MSELYVVLEWAEWRLADPSRPEKTEEELWPHVSNSQVFELLSDAEAEAENIRESWPGRFKTRVFRLVEVSL